MTALSGNLTRALAASAGVLVAAFAITSVDAGAVRGHSALAAQAAVADVAPVACVRSLSNLWSCNDPLVGDRRDVRVRERREVQAQGPHRLHPCDHASDTARNGSRCGNRAADRRAGGR